MTTCLDSIDHEAIREGDALTYFQSAFALAGRPCTRSQAKRAILRGAPGARLRQGLKRFFGNPLETRQFLPKRLAAHS